MKQLLLRVVLLCVLIGSCGGIPDIAVRAALLYTRTFMITNTSGAAQTSYPIEVVFDTAAEIAATRMRNDCGDIRVFDTDGVTQLSYNILNCNTNFTALIVLIPSLPTGTTTNFYVRYGDPTLTTTAVTSFFDVYQMWNATAPTCTTSGAGLLWDSTNFWLRLTQNVGAQAGNCNYSYLSTMPNRGYKLWFDAWAGGSVGGADAVWQYAFNSGVPTEEDITLGGVHYTLDEFADRMCYTRSTTSNGACTATFANATLDNSTWRTIKTTYDSTQKRLFENGVQRIATNLGTAPTITNTNFGLSARTGGSFNEHRVRRLALIRFAETITSSALSALTTPQSSTLSFTLRNAADTAAFAQLCDYGDVVVGALNSCQYRIKVSTNATGGYSVFATTTGNFVNGAASFVPNAAVGTGGAGGTPVIAGTATYGIQIAAGNCDGTVTVPVIFSPLVGNATQFNYTTATTVYSCNSTINPAFTDLAKTALIDHRLVIRGDTPAGIYSQSVTWTVVPNF